MTMPSLSSRVATALLIVSRSKHRLDSPDQVRRYIDHESARPASYAPPARLRRKARFALETAHGWNCYRVASHDSTRPERAVVYVHGGSFIAEIIPRHWSLITTLATRAGAEVIVPIYPLAPHSTALQTIGTTADITADVVAEFGAENVTLMGDSAGGNIAIEAAINMRDRVGIPRQLILISPIVDATKSNPAAAAIAPHDAMLTIAGSTEGARYYAAGLDLADPLISPLHADLAGLPPMTIFSGTYDINNPDTRTFVATAREAGISVDYHEAPGLQHVYAILPTKEGAEARDLIVKLVRK
jgi:acetyl esterase/lipase